MDKRCISCGMPMQKPGDFAQRDESREYCCHCARPDGEMKSYAEALESMTAFMIKTRGLAEGPAREAVRDMMARLPAWKDQ